MMAPLMDHNKIRYFIGCQIDITHLIEGGRGLESMKSLLDLDSQSHNSDPPGSKPSIRVLRELGSLFNDEETEVVRPCIREGRSSFGSGLTTQTRSMQTHSRTRSARRFVGMDDTIEQNPWPPNQFGQFGGMPGVYQNVRLAKLIMRLRSVR
jgi:hypothetical protein